MTTDSAFSVLGVWGGAGERILTPRAANARVMGPGLLVLLHTMNLGFVTDLGKVIFPLASDYKRGQRGSAESVNKMLRASLQAHDHKVLENKS